MFLVLDDSGVEHDVLAVCTLLSSCLIWSVDTLGRLDLDSFYGVLEHNRILCACLNDSFIIPAFAHLHYSVIKWYIELRESCSIQEDLGYNLSHSPT